MKLEWNYMRSFAKAFVSHFTLGLIGWLTGFLGLGISVIIICTVLYSMHGVFQKYKLLRISVNQKLFRNEKEAIRTLLEDSPWILYPDTEPVEWFNKVVVKLWPFMTTYMMNYIKLDLEVRIRELLPKKLQSFQFGVLDLGDLPPKVSGIKVYKENQAKDEIIMDLELFYAGDANITTKISHFEAGIKALLFRSRLRIVFKPLQARLPFVGGMQLFLLNKPSLQFEFTDLASMLEVPGLYDILKNGVLDYISDYMLLPNMLAFSFSDSVDGTNLKVVEPKGILKVDLLEAKDLAMCDQLSQSDPYAILTVGHEAFTSETVKNSTNPVWCKETFFFTVVDTSAAELKVSLFDNDDSTKDDCLGDLIVSLDYLISNPQIDFWRELENSQGSVHLACQWMTLTSDLSSVTDNIKPYAILSVFVHSAKNLKLASFDMTEPSTKVKLKITPKEKFTKAVLNSCNPYFGENFHFLIDYPKLETLSVDVQDAKSKKSLGNVTIPVAHCLEEERMVIETQPYLLRGSSTDSQILLRMSLKYLTPYTNPKDSEGDVKAETSESLVPLTTDSMPIVDTSLSSQEISIEPRARSNTVDSTSKILDAAEPVPKPKKSVEFQKQIQKFENDESKKLNSIDRRRSHGDIHFVKGVQPTLGSKRGSIFGGDKGFGQIQMSVHCNLKGKLKVTVHSCRELRQSTDTYVKLYLIPDKISKKSQIVKDSFNPVFNESFEFDIVPNEASKKMLEVTVKSYESVFSREELGQVLIQLSDFDLAALTTRWFPLEPVRKDR